jgi:hypothetical protein
MRSSGARERSCELFHRRYDTPFLVESQPVEATDQGKREVALSVLGVAVIWSVPMLTVPMNIGVHRERRFDTSRSDGRLLLPFAVAICRRQLPVAISQLPRLTHLNGDNIGEHQAVKRLGIRC